MTRFLALVCAFCLPVQAHEFWMSAQPFNPAANGTSELSLHVGEQFAGERLPFTQAYVAGLVRHACGARVDVLPSVPQELPTMGLPVRLACPGVHVWAMESHPAEVTLSADKFEAYLHAEGLDHIVQARKAAGQSAAAARERYQRHVKSIVVAKQDRGSKNGGKTALDVRTGQLLEIVPTASLLAPASAAARKFSVFFAGRPLANALVKAWHVQANQTTVLHARADAKGQVAFSLPYAGAWMVSTVHMTQSRDPGVFDWDSFWGNLTFYISAS